LPLDYFHQRAKPQLVVVNRAEYVTLDVDSKSAPTGATGQYTTDPAYVCATATAASGSESKAAARPVWVTEDFKMGDCVILPMGTLHMSTTNTTDKYRISCDTRWQPVAEPHDERWSTDAGWRRQLDPKRLAERGEEGATEIKQRPNTKTRQCLQNEVHTA
jgi:hypothetical protein